MARRKRLTDAGIARLAPERCEYTVWDTLTHGLGLRVRPSGSRTFVYRCRTEAGLRKMSFGPAALRKVHDVRRDCRAAAAEAAAAAETADTGNRDKPPTFRAFVEGPWKAACLDRCKTSTRNGFTGLLRQQLLPAFGNRPLDRIAHAEVARWFDKASRTAPGRTGERASAFSGGIGCGAAAGHGVGEGERRTGTAAAPLAPPGTAGAEGPQQPASTETGTEPEAKPSSQGGLL